MRPVESWLLIACGGALGSCLRFWLGVRIAARAGSALPWATLAINVSGSLLLGFVLARTVAHPLLDARLRALVAVGFCGGFTTFSSFAWETVKLAETRGAAWALANVSASVLLSLAAAVAGAALARELA